MSSNAIILWEPPRLSLEGEARHGLWVPELLAGVPLAQAASHPMDRILQSKPEAESYQGREERNKEHNRPDVAFSEKIGFRHFRP